MSHLVWHSTFFHRHSRTWDLTGTCAESINIYSKLLCPAGCEPIGGFDLTPASRVILIKLSVLVAGMRFPADEPRPGASWFHMGVVSLKRSTVTRTDSWRDCNLFLALVTRLERGTTAASQKCGRKMCSWQEENTKLPAFSGPESSGTFSFSEFFPSSSERLWTTVHQNAGQRCSGYDRF